MSDTTFTIRRATQADAIALGHLGALLWRLHHQWDQRRFTNPSPTAEADYSAFLVSQLADEHAAVFVAEQSAAVIGYAYAALEPGAFKELRDPCGYVHDVAVLEEDRRTGVATALIQAAAEWLEAKGAPRVVIWTAEHNIAAQRLFDRLGFRRTMIEMTREL
jgi:ribosomal protein S18 acetylase RimI-like enzyme